jgi:hypothetical protein
MGSTVLVLSFQCSVVGGGLRIKRCTSVIQGGGHSNFELLTPLWSILIFISFQKHYKFK